jgi:hypothetical protein
VFPPSWPSGTIICTSLNLHYVRKLSCKYDLFWLSGSQGIFFNDLTKFLHYFCYLPFEEDLALYFNNLEFPLPKDALYQIWLKLACWFWTIFFFDINTSEYGFPYCGPSEPLGPWFEETWIYIISESFHVNMTYSGSVVQKKIFKLSHSIFVIISSLKRTWPFIWII